MVTKGHNGRTKTLRQQFGLSKRGTVIASRAPGREMGTGAAHSLQRIQSLRPCYADLAPHPCQRWERGRRPQARARVVSFDCADKLGSLSNGKRTARSEYPGRLYRRLTSLLQAGIVDWLLGLRERFAHLSWGFVCNGADFSKEAHGPRSF
jgi:hypothetical protein